MSLIALVVTNVVVLGIALHLGMTLRALMLIYWIQSVVIGACNVVRILSLHRFSTQGFSAGGQALDETPLTRRKTATFFALHYGVFHVAYLLFLLGGAKGELGAPGAYALCALAFVLNHLFSLRRNLAHDAAGRPHIGTLMFMPYVRVVPMHVMILTGLGFGGSTASIVFFAILKTIDDAAMHVVEHRVYTTPGPHHGGLAMERRDFLQSMTAIGATAAGLPMSAHAAYNPRATFEVEVREVPFRTTAKGRQLLARIYQPMGAGPFPMVLDLHGGAWTRKDRFANEPMDRAIAASGVLVVAIDMTLGAEAPYPANVRDASYGVRWLKSKAAEWRGDPATLGLLGSSTGGHIAELIAMRPRHPLYNTIALPGFDDTIAYVAARSPISNPYTRWQQAEKKQNKNLIEASKTYFRPWQTIHEANPQEILERKEPAVLKPLLILQGELDDNVLPAEQEKFAATYRAAGGQCQYELFKGAVHEWTAEPGPLSDRAAEMVKTFIARNLGG